MAVDAETADLLDVLAVMVSMSNSVKYIYKQHKQEIESRIEENKTKKDRKTHLSVEYS